MHDSPKDAKFAFFSAIFAFLVQGICGLHQRLMWGASFCKDHDAYVIELVVALWNRRRHESFTGSFLLSEAIICIILALNYTQEPSIKHFDVLKKADSEAFSSSSKSKLLRRLHWSWCSLLSDANAIEVNENAQLDSVCRNRQETVTLLSIRHYHPPLWFWHIPCFRIFFLDFFGSKRFNSFKKNS